MLDTILVPWDGSVLAERVLPYARSLAWVAHGTLVLFQAVPEVAFCPRAEQLVEELARRLRRDGVTVETVVRWGDSAPLILEVASARAAGLIVLSTHGQAGLGRWLYGSVVEKVLRHTPVPVLLLPSLCDRPWPSRGPRRLLVLLDGSAMAEEALPPAAALARLLDVPIELVQVVDPDTLYASWSSEPVGPVTQSDVEAQQAQAQRYLESVAQRIAVAGQIVVPAAAPGPAAGVAAIVREQTADLIVLTTQGKGGPTPATLGRAATAVVQRASVPLLLVRPVAAPAAPAPPALGDEGPLVSLTLNQRELDYLRRGLERLFGEVEPAESAYRLHARLVQAAAAAAQGVTTATRER